jgi:hypothetical protein
LHNAGVFSKTLIVLPKEKHARLIKFKWNFSKLRKTEKTQNRERKNGNKKRRVIKAGEVKNYERPKLKDAH